MANHPGTVRVLAGVIRPPLLETHEASVVEFRDRFGDLMALVSRHFSDDMWIFVTKDDPDWQSELVRLGYAQAPGGLRQLLSDAKAP